MNVGWPYASDRVTGIVRESGHSGSPAGVVVGTRESRAALSRVTRRVTCQVAQRGVARLTSGD